MNSLIYTSRHHFTPARDKTCKKKNLKTHWSFFFIQMSKLCKQLNKFSLGNSAKTFSFYQHYLIWQLTDSVCILTETNLVLRSSRQSIAEVFSILLYFGVYCVAKTYNIWNIIELERKKKARFDDSFLLKYVIFISLKRISYPIVKIELPKNNF